MNRYSRIPSFLVLVLAASLCVLYARTWGRAVAGGQGLDALEKVIASGKADKQTWFHYAEALSAAQKYSRAAQAYQKVLEMDPSARPAKFGCALALAQANEKDPLYSYVGDLVFTEPKLVMDLLDRPELKDYMAEPRFVALQKEARAQAMD